jgi:hypothetical protein
MAAPGSIVPAIDHGVFAALAAGSKSAPAVSPLQQLARGSVPPSFTPPPDDLDHAETLGDSNGDLDEDAMTRTHNPVT